MSQFDGVEYQKLLIAAFGREASADHRQDSITVSAGEARYRIPSSGVSSVDPVPPATPIPRALPWVLGVSNVRGRILTLAHFEHLVTGKPGAAPAYCLSLHGSPYALAVNIDLSDENAPLVDLATLLPACVIAPHAAQRPFHSA